MYSTCLYCHRSLGRNELFEQFPIGRRLAFDADRGRLWVLCRNCGRWNLSPLEERWEVVEACERQFRETRLRVSTENIGLARAREGTDLVRIGKALRPEMAAWRYGDQFGFRYRRKILRSSITAAVMIPLWWTGSLYAALAAVPGGLFAFNAVTLFSFYRERRAIVVRAELGSGKQVVVRGKHMRTAELVATSTGEGAGWSLRVDHDNGTARLQGADGMRIAGRLLARMNQAGAGAKVVRRAVERLQAEGDSDRLFARFAAKPRQETTILDTLGYRAGNAFDGVGALRSLATADRLALEMAAHEDVERRAMEGELAVLAEAWREAEEIAAIADSL